MDEMDEMDDRSFARTPPHDRARNVCCRCCVLRSNFCCRQQFHAHGFASARARLVADQRGRVTK
jgi:hypothetical protein